MVSCKKSSKRFRDGVRHARLCVVTAGVVLATIAASSPADTIVVTTDSGGTGGPNCTLRDAMTAANTDTATGGCPAGNGADAIELPADSTIMLTEVDNFEQDYATGSSGLPAVTSIMTIDGNGATVRRDDAEGTPAFRIIKVWWGGDLTLNNLVVSGGYAFDSIEVGWGGFIGAGGGIYNKSTLTLIDTTVSENTAFYNGGGLLNYGTLTLTNTTVSGNRSSHWGGGIYNRFGTMTITNSTVSGNTAFDGVIGGHGGGIYNFATATVANSTITGNTSGYPYVAGIASGYGTITLTNCIVANSIDGADCGRLPFEYGTVIDGGYNIIADGSCLSDRTSMSGDPNLGPLANFGGATLTHALLSGSIAIDAGDCAGGTITTDQRGVPRPRGLACDIGAFEVQRPEAPRHADAQ